MVACRIQPERSKVYLVAEACQRMPLGEREARLQLAVQPTPCGDVVQVQRVIQALKSAIERRR